MLDPNDIWGDLFDFDGDGKTDWTEELIAFQILRECEKGNEENKQVNSNAKKPKKELQTIKDVPAELTEQSYKEYRSEMVVEIIATVLALVFCSSIIFVIMWAAISAANESYNNAGEIVSIVICIAGVAVIGIFSYTAFHSVSVAKGNIDLAKSRMSGNDPRGLKEPVNKGFSPRCCPPWQQNGNII